MDFQLIFKHAFEIIGAVVMILNGLILITALIPGEHPDKELQAIVDFIKKFSRK